MQNPWFSTWIHVESYSGQWLTNLPSADLEGMFLRAAWLAHSHHWKPPQRAGNTCHQGTCWSEISPRLITTGGDISLGSFSQQTIFFFKWGHNGDTIGKNWLAGEFGTSELRVSLLYLMNAVETSELGRL
jgi:hypothetical protein